MDKESEIISACNGLIYTIINKHFKGYEREDLYHEGVKGVIKAYNNYKNNQNTKFSTYAYKYIFGEIYAYVNKTKLMKVSKDHVILYKKINEAYCLLSQKLMKEPSLYELSSFLEIEPEIIENVISSMGKIDSLDRVIYSEGKNINYYDMISDDKDYYNIDYMLLNEEINKLPPEEKKLIYLRYFEDLTQSEVASILGISQVGVSRTEKKVLTKMRNNYQNVA